MILVIISKFLMSAAGKHTHNITYPTPSLSVDWVFFSYKFHFAVNKHIFGVRWFYSISTIVSYLIPNPFNTNILDLYDL